MRLVDTHCHIQSAGRSDGERITRQIWAKEAHLTGQLLAANAVSAGVTKMICVGCDLADSGLAIDFVKDQPACWASIGIHPHEAQHYAGDTAKRGEFAGLINKPKVVAVGECGLDYYYEHSPKAAQVEILKFQIELALKHDKPMIFHVREAFSDFWPIFDNYPNVRGVLHSFTDNAANLEEALKRGLYVGVNGIATFAKNEAQIAVYKSIPLSNLLLETDAPFLTPTPYRGSINEPKHVGTIAEFMAKLRGEDLGQLAAATTSNAQKLFGIRDDT